jgi:hypothetical protein
MRVNIICRLILRTCEPGRKKISIWIFSDAGQKVNPHFFGETESGIPLAQCIIERLIHADVVFP